MLIDSLILAIWQHCPNETTKGEVREIAEKILPIVEDWITDLKQKNYDEACNHVYMIDRSGKEVTITAHCQLCGYLNSQEYLDNQTE